MARLGRAYPAKGVQSKLLPATGNSFSDSVTEAASATDAENAVATFTASDTEAGAATDTETAVAVFAAAVSEAGAATDADSTTAVFAASDTEGASASDSSSTGFSDSVTETASATDSESAAAIFAADVSESGTATDAPSTAAIYSAADTEAATATDADAVAAAFVAADAEAAVATDSADAAFGNQTYNVDVTEAANASDSSDASGPSSAIDTHDGFGPREYKFWKEQQDKAKRKKPEEKPVIARIVQPELPKPLVSKPISLPMGKAKPLVNYAPVRQQLRDIKQTVREASEKAALEAKREEREILALIENEERELLRTLSTLMKALEDA